ncbi:hypothetical protein BQ8794_240081 [Mesorhizobium prunaredense]|uniref:Uncharacterized protein n=2 Tax=Mesorhizobium TaxID=68287 RepID=A0A1R3V7K2_9HYPH|nr:conserved hypothetical protein [Mesorhizobium ventifaucium]SIT55874.1 hypothetical protein BQ8794_240081 [Mesorhizobium prunaredense]
MPASKAQALGLIDIRAVLRWIVERHLQHPRPGVTRLAPPAAKWRRASARARPRIVRKL